MKKLIIASVAILMALTACVKDGLYPYTTFSSLENTIAYDENDDVTVTVKASALQNRNQRPPELQEHQTVAMSWTARSSRLPSRPSPWTNVVEFYIVAKNDGRLQVGRHSPTPWADPIDWTHLKLNEMVRRTDEEQVHRTVNTGDKHINIKGVTISKDEGTGGPASTVKAGAPHGFFAIIGAKEGMHRARLLQRFLRQEDRAGRTVRPQGQQDRPFQAAKGGRGPPSPTQAPERIPTV